MPIEIEKKYRLTESQREEIVTRLVALGIQPTRLDFEENSIYTNDSLKSQEAIVRIRRIGDRSILTFKKRFPAETGIKYQLEEETEVQNADAIDAILKQLGLSISLVYEKRRQTWNYSECEIAIDELPFGWFMEIEGPEDQIKGIENELEISDLGVEEATYPALTRSFGVKNHDVVEARFAR